jgi:hypothetical protein
MSDATVIAAFAAARKSQAPLATLPEDTPPTSTAPSGCNAG